MVIKEAALLTNNLEELEDFYLNTLGLTLKDKADNSFTIYTGISLLTFKKNFGTDRPFYHFAFNIPENQIKEAKEWIKERTALIKLDDDDEFDFASWNAHSVYFYDPSGNILELIARHNLSNTSSSEFSGKSFLSISEMGLPVHDVNNFYNEINDKLSIPVFSGDKNTFCAAGDDHGLFIIVNDGRKWFPDCDNAKIFPAEIKISTNLQAEVEFKDPPYKIIHFSE